MTTGKNSARKMPRQKPGRSKQDYQTPREFIKALERRFGRITIDLAASEKNAVCKKYIDKKKDSLKRPWPTKGVLFLNPPYRWLRPWFAKCAEHRKLLKKGSVLLVLVPASIGSIWFEKHVLDKADVEGLRPRLTFRRMKWPYPKDLMLLIYKPEPMVYPPMTMISTWAWNAKDIPRPKRAFDEAYQ
jgi:phage N-6-adenine-methyltransferase